MSGASGGRRVLLVDDDPVILRGYGQRLRNDGYDVTTAADGYEALAQAQQRAFDVILLDLRIPYRNGVEVLRTLRQRKELATTPIFILAQPGDADFVDRAMREGADGVLEKAKLAPRDVVAEVEAILDGRRPRRPAPPPQSPVGPAASQVPTAVDEIARRFRRDAPPATPASPPRPAARSIAGMPAVSVAQTAPRPGRASEDDPSLSPSLAGASASVRSVLSPTPTMPNVSPDALSPPYDVILNRMVGQSGPLAQALGLPLNYACPICTGPLILRLEPDAQMEWGVRGHFYCPRCTQPS